MATLKALSKLEMKLRAASVFGRYKEAKKVAVTSDGQCFIIDKSDLAAQNHAAKNMYGKKLDIETFEADEFATMDAKKPAKDVVAEIAALTAIDDLQTLIAEEKAGENRKSILDAASKRIDELKAVEKQSLVAAITAATTVEAVNAIKTVEAAGENRADVIAAADAKIATLQPVQ